MLKLNLAKQAMLTGVAALAFAAPAHAQSLESVLGTGKNATAQNAAAQQQVERLADQADAALRDYRATLQQIDDLQLFVDRQGIFLDSQNAEIETLNSQLGTVEQVKQGIVPMMLKMVIELEDSIKNDIPFRKTERLERVATLKRILANPNVPPADQYRQVLTAFNIETNYGYGVEAYQAAHPLKKGNIVNFVRYGRTGWAFMSKDETEMRYFDSNGKTLEEQWKPLEGIDAVQMRQAIRIAKEQAAPDLVVAPIVIQSN